MENEGIEDKWQFRSLKSRDKNVVVCFKEKRRGEKPSEGGMGGGPQREPFLCQHNSLRDPYKPGTLKFILLNLKALGRFFSNCMKQ